MKVTIDTKEDTHEDMQKILHLLSQILERKNQPQKTEEIDTTAMMNMFDEPLSSNDEKKDTAPDFSNFLNLVQRKEEPKREEKPKIEFF